MDVGIETIIGKIISMNDCSENDTQGDIFYTDIVFKHENGDVTKIPIMQADRHFKEHIIEGDPIRICYLKFHLFHRVLAVCIGGKTVKSTPTKTFEIVHLVEAVIGASVVLFSCLVGPQWLSIFGLLLLVWAAYWIWSSYEFSKIEQKAHDEF